MEDKRPARERWLTAQGELKKAEEVAGIAQAIADGQQMYKTPEENDEIFRNIVFGVADPELRRRIMTLARDCSCDRHDCRD